MSACHIQENIDIVIALPSTIYLKSFIFLQNREIISKENDQSRNSLNINIFGVNEGFPSEGRESQSRLCLETKGTKTLVSSQSHLR